jgi:hypothetical protein
VPLRGSRSDTYGRRRAPMAATKKSDRLKKPRTDANEHGANASLNPVLSVPNTIDESVSATNDAYAFVAIFDDLSAKSRESLAAVKRKLGAPIRRVLYQDLVDTIWTAWRVRPDNVTVNHIAHALDLLARKSEGGVELDRVSSEAAGIDYPQLMLLIRPSRVHASDMSTGAKVPRKAADQARASGRAVLRAKSVGDQIEGYRKECRMTFEDLAEKIGVNTRTVQRHIADACMPHARHLGGYERVFSRSLNRKIVIKKIP